MFMRMTPGRKPERNIQIISNRSVVVKSIETDIAAGSVNRSITFISHRQ